MKPLQFFFLIFSLLHLRFFYSFSQTGLTVTLHDKKVDAIAKGMLKHSRTSSGEKIPTDINALANEYLRLSYHGMKATNKSFNAVFETDFDSNLFNVNVMPKGIGREFLNFINNGFYAWTIPRSTDGRENITPTLNVKITVLKSLSGDSHLLDGQVEVEISVKKKGPGILNSIKDKIFHSLFTTKLTGQGTGLGLSWSYDIVNAHGGKMSINSKENEGAEFAVVLPV